MAGFALVNDRLRRLDLPGPDPEAVHTAVTRVLPSGTSIRLISAPVLIATKLEAFADRGHGDFLAGHDLEDITTIADGRRAAGVEAGWGRHVRRHTI